MLIYSILTHVCFVLVETQMLSRLTFVRFPNQITNILYFNDTDRYQSFLGWISVGHIDQELITNATETDTTRGKYKKHTDQQHFQIGKYRRRMALLHRCKGNDLTFPKSTKVLSEFKKKYKVQLRHSKNNAGQEAAKGLTTEKRVVHFY